MAVSLSDSPPSQGPSCPVCYRDYSDSEKQLIPRILQCGHTYCSECLDRLLNTEPDEDDYQQIVLNIRYAGREWTTTRNYPRSRYSSNELKCPTCMTMNHVQNKDVSSLTKNFALLGCLTPTVTRSKHFCKDHNHEKRIYCNDCKTLICAYCQLYGGHTGHSHVVATEASKPSVQALKEAEEGLVEDLEKLTLGKGDVNTTISKLAKTRRRCEKNVKKYFNGAVEKLEVQKDLLLTQIASWTEEQMFILNAQLDMLTKASKDLKDVQSSCQSLVLGDPLDALTDHQKVEDNVKTLRLHVNDLSLQPLISPWMKTKTDGPYDEMLSSMVNNFKLSYDTDTETAEDKEGEEKGEDGEEGDTPGNQSGDDENDESDSSDDSLLDEMGMLSDITSVDCQSGLRMGVTGAHNSSEGRKGRRADKLMYSQETHNTRADLNTSVDTVGSEASHQFSIGQDLNWVSSINPVPSVGVFGQRMIHTFHRTMSDESGSTASDVDNTHPLSHDPPSYNIPARLRVIGQQRMLDVSTDDSDRELDRQRLHDLSSSEGGGAERTFDPMEIRRHWDFLNDQVHARRSSGMGGATGNSSKDEEDECVTSFHSLLYEPDIRSAHSEDSSPSPRPLLHSTSNDFAFPHHLTLPVDSNRDPDDEVVFPSSRLYSWTGRRVVEPLQSSLLDDLDPSPDREDAHSDMEDFEEEDAN